MAILIVQRKGYDPEDDTRTLKINLVGENPPRGREEINEAVGCNGCPLAESSGLTLPHKVRPLEYSRDGGYGYCSVPDERVGEAVCVKRTRSNVERFSG